MAFKAKDGSSHTNRDTMKRADASHMAKQPSPAAGVMEHGEPDGDEGMGAPDVHSVVDQHGPAQEVHVQHDHASGRHHVMSMHQDGHQHESDHASAGEAHDAGKCLSGDCDCGAM